MDFEHVPVLLRESIAALNIKPQGVYVDCTAGGGGHSSAIAELLSPDGRLIAVDRDPQAIEVLQKRFDRCARVSVVKDNFFNIKDILRAQRIDAAHGILADLGVSSHQLDDATRGFSFHSDAALDMRMSMEGVSAAQAVNSLTQSQLRDIIYRYGEEKFAPRIAAAIVRERAAKPIESTTELVEIIKSAIPAASRREGGHPARRTFQALRIYVNGELDGLSQALRDMFDSLHIGGRLAVISFHSLEDRTVKQTFASLCEGCTCPPEFPVCVCGKKSPGRLPQKAASAGARELEENPRSRSARLRVIERVE